MNVIRPGKTIGILGGGQLGRMMALSAREMGYKIAVLDPKKNSPCGQIADYEIIGAYDDVGAAKRLADVSDVITYEFENIDNELVGSLAEHAYLPQGQRLIQVTQNRELEKQMVKQCGLPVAPYEIVHDREDVYEAIEHIGYPSVMKTCLGGYDGKGQHVIRTEQDIAPALKLLENGHCIIEKWLQFDKEISVIVTRSTTGEVRTFPVAENVHINNILHQTIVPARIKPSVIKKAENAAFQLAKEFNLVGTLAVEMFVTDDENIYINEMAPRPHNSGHYTINACVTSQFEQHIRAVCGLPLGSSVLHTNAVMVNLLGEHVEPALQNIEMLQKGKLHLYGKEEAKASRKMGHITFLTSNVEKLLHEINHYNVWKDEMEELYND
jgi:5-(carboxyamino)imidazole ribonucleotide synthase